MNNMEMGDMNEMALMQMREQMQLKMQELEDAKRKNNKDHVRLLEEDIKSLNITIDEVLDMEAREMTKKDIDAKDTQIN